VGKPQKKNFKPNGAHHAFQFRKSKVHIVLPFGKLVDSHRNKIQNWRLTMCSIVKKEYPLQTYKSTKFYQLAIVVLKFHTIIDLNQ
jgi:hypothetical protein